MIILVVVVAAGQTTVYICTVYYDLYCGVPLSHISSGSVIYISAEDNANFGLVHWFNVDK